MRLLLSIILTLAFLLSFSSCENKEEMALKEKFDSLAVVKNDNAEKVSEVTIMDYVDMEKSINKKYVEDLQNLVESDFEEKVSAFEDEELGFFNSYKHMFKVLVDSEDDLQDYWGLKCAKHFSPLPTEKKMHELYLSYVKDIKNLRRQVSSSDEASSKLPTQVKVYIPQEDISLTGLIEHSYTNLFVEFGLDKAIVFLVSLVFQIIALIALPITEGGKKIIYGIGFGISMILSIILSIYNDNKMTNSIREQHTQNVMFDYTSMQNDLDAKTISYYEALRN